MSKPDVVIRKYSDRRLYDTRASRYVKLRDVARMIRDGLDVQVRDARSGKDLTYVILTQIVVENAREATALPLELLRQIIRASDKATQDFLSRYLSGTLDLYQKAQEAARIGFSEARTAVSNPLEFVRNLLPGSSVPTTPHAGAVATPDAREVERLRRRVEELEARLTQGRKSAPRARKRKRSARQQG